jgi:transcriptional regulator with XRE-family HTH domain
MGFDLKKIRNERINQGISYQSLAELTGLKAATISQLEKGITVPRDATIGKILKALGKKVEDFEMED